MCVFPVIREANVVQLDMDSEVDHNVLSSRTVGQDLNLVAMETESPVFIGGAPGERQYLHTLTRER